MDLITIMLFFVYMWGLGFAVTKLIKHKSEPYNPLEENLMNLGIGISAFIVIALVLNLLHIPIDWKIFLVLSLIFPLYYLIITIKNKTFPKFKIKITKSNIHILIVLILFAFTFYMYHTGAFAYPYLEDDDPWNYAFGAEYVSMEKTAYEPIGLDKMNYIDAYPPGYTLIFGVLHQTSSDLMWTMKFFNALIISLGIIFFYFFVKHFTGSSSKALFSTFALAMIPCYLSHFIWAHSLMPTLFFAVMYCLEQMKNSKKWGFAAALTIAAICLSQPSQPVKFAAMFFIYWAVKAAFQRKWFLDIVAYVSSGYILSIILWWIPMLFKYGSNLLSEGLGWTAGGAGGALAEKSGVIGPIGSATRFYNFNDFFFAQSQNMINNPVGIGIVICLLTILAVILLLIGYKNLKEENNQYKLITLLWLIFTFCGLYGGTVFPIALESFMFWMLLAIPVSIIASEAVWFLFAIGKNIKIIKWAVLLVLIISIWYTSGQQKFDVNTAQWGPGGWLGPAPGTIYSFLWMRENLPVNTPVFVFSRIGGMTPGFGLYSCEWCEDVIDFKKDTINKSVEEVHSWLKNKGYKYAMVDDYYTKDYGYNETNSMLNNMASSELYRLVYQPDINGQKLFGFVFKII